ncbi:MAG: AAA family ATPase [Phycisphaerae bacterium]|nr:AAA family ATPase [Phycisphaerae bacterium]
MGNPISKITIKGFKSIRNQEIELRNLNILIGPNGAGKSNFLQFFQLLRAIAKGRFQIYVEDGADRILYLGSKVTHELVGCLQMRQHEVSWEFKIFPSKTNKLLFFEETVTGGPSTLSSKWAKKLDHGLSESTLFSKGNKDHDEYVAKIREAVQPVMESWVAYHFHDTSDFAKVKLPYTKRDYEYLYSDARNLATFLLFLKKKYEKEYQRIRETIQLAAPFFDDFRLLDEENKDDIVLEWKQKGSNYPFLSSQISDGTLRFMCLTTALLQPEPPSTILLDEPELGLHPHALVLLAEMIKAASVKTQVIVSTQSPLLIDYFEPQDIIVVNRENGESKFRRLDEEKLKLWLEDYSLGELWQKNIFEDSPGYE